LVRQCRVCGTPDMGNHTHCRVCRSPLEVPASSTPTQISSTPSSPPQSSPRATPIFPPEKTPSFRARPANVAPQVAPARHSRSFFWFWIAGGGCVLVFLCSACALLILWSAYTQGYLGP
jgi:hypothetical protein